MKLNDEEMIPSLSCLILHSESQFPLKNDVPENIVNGKLNKRLKELSKQSFFVISYRLQI